MITAVLVKEAVNRAERPPWPRLLHERRLFHAAFATADQKRAWPPSWKSASRSSGIDEGTLFPFPGGWLIGPAHMRGPA